MMSIINVNIIQNFTSALYKHQRPVVHYIKHQRAHSALYLIYCTGGPFEVYLKLLALSYSNSQIVSSLQSLFIPFLLITMLM